MLIVGEGTFQSSQYPQIAWADRSEIWALREASSHASGSHGRKKRFLR